MAGSHDGVNGGHHNQKHKDHDQGDGRAFGSKIVKPVCFLYFTIQAMFPSHCQEFFIRLWWAIERKRSPRVIDVVVDQRVGGDKRVSTKIWISL